MASIISDDLSDPPSTSNLSIPTAIQRSSDFQSNTGANSNDTSVHSWEYDGFNLRYLSREYDVDNVGEKKSFIYEHGSRFIKKSDQQAY